MDTTPRTIRWAAFAVCFIRGLGKTGKSDDTRPDRRAVLANLQPTSTGSARAGSASSVVGTLRARAGAPATRASLPVHPVATVRQESGQPVELVPRLRQWSLRRWTNHCPSKTAGEMTMTTRPGGSATTNNRPLGVAVHGERGRGAERDQCGCASAVGGAIDTTWLGGVSGADEQFAHADQACQSLSVGIRCCTLARVAGRGSPFLI
jgi:hypothetical protein